MLHRKAVALQGPGLSSLPSLLSNVKNWPVHFGDKTLDRILDQLVILVLPITHSSQFRWFYVWWLFILWPVYKLMINFRSHLFILFWKRFHLFVMMYRELIIKEFSWLFWEVGTIFWISRLGWFKGDLTPQCVIPSPFWSLLTASHYTAVSAV